MTLGELCDWSAGARTLVIELKSRFDGDLRLVARAAAVLATTRARSASMSFDPALVAALRRDRARARRAASSRERRYAHREWQYLGRCAEARLAYLLHAPATPPAFRRLLGAATCRRLAPRWRASVRPAAADLDGAHRRRPRSRRTLGRPDDLRRISAVTLSHRIEREHMLQAGSPCTLPRTSDLSRHVA